MNQKADYHSLDDRHGLKSKLMLLCVLHLQIYVHELLYSSF